VPKGVKSDVNVYQFKVYLKHIEPLIWRRCLIPGDATFDEIHLMLQAIMGWENYHLHMFTMAGKRYGIPDIEEFDILGLFNEAEYRLDEIITKPGDMLEYDYDFGDGWQHVLEVEAIRARQVNEILPRCTAGERSCPPEDVGGIGGYHHYLEALKNAAHPEHEFYLNWRGPFDPEKFSLAVINHRLNRITQGKNAYPFGFTSAKKLKLAKRYYLPLIQLSDKLDAEQYALTEILPAREDMVVLLEYLRNHRVTGTQAANLPLKAAKEISAGFVDPPSWEVQISDREVQHIRSSADIWSIDFLMLLARVGNLISGGESRRFYLTPEGAVFLEAPPPLQVWFLFATWWMGSNWLYVVSGLDEEEDELPAGFQEIVEAHLAALPVEKSFPYALFAEQLIAAVRLDQEEDSGGGLPNYLYDLLEDMIVLPLTDLGVISPTYENYMPGAFLTSRLVSITLTRLGSNMLQSILP
jgi:hypothetical protein